MVSESSGEGDDGQCRVGGPSGSEDRTAGDIEIVIAMDLAIGIDHADPRIAAHGGRSHRVAAATGIADQCVIVNEDAAFVAAEYSLAELFQYLEYRSYSFAASHAHGLQKRQARRVAARRQSDAIIRAGPHLATNVDIVSDEVALVFVAQETLNPINRIDLPFDQFHRYGQFTDLRISRPIGEDIGNELAKIGGWVWRCQSPAPDHSRSLDIMWMLHQVAANLVSLIADARIAARRWFEQKLRVAHAAGGQHQTLMIGERNLSLRAVILVQRQCSDVASRCIRLQAAHGGAEEHIHGADIGQVGLISFAKSHGADYGSKRFESEAGQIACFIGIDDPVEIQNVGRGVVIRSQICERNWPRFEILFIQRCTPAAPDHGGTTKSADPMLRPVLISEVTARIHRCVGGLDVLVITVHAGFDDQAGFAIGPQPVCQAAACWTATDDQNVIFGRIDGCKTANLCQSFRPLAPGPIRFKGFLL